MIDNIIIIVNIIITIIIIIIISVVIITILLIILNIIIIIINIISRIIVIIIISILRFIMGAFGKQTSILWELLVGLGVCLYILILPAMLIRVRGSLFFSQTALFRAYRPYLLSESESSFPIIDF